jgi:hypothetical protein
MQGLDFHRLPRKQGRTRPVRCSGWFGRSENAWRHEIIVQIIVFDILGKPEESLMAQEFGL